MGLENVLRFLPNEISGAIRFFNENDIQEIRIIAECSCTALVRGRLCDTGVKVSKAQLSKIIADMCRGSMYAVQPSLVRGYLTLAGGHRVGVCGNVTVENGSVKYMGDISAVCIRIAREVKGVADKFINTIESGGRLFNTLIISPPGCGKTTVLRDIARNLGNRYRVCIADERSEIAACEGGICKNDVGKYTCVLDGVPKGVGIEMLLRTMSPEVIITDETGSVEEERAIYQIINCGAKIITSVHGYSEKDVSRRKYIGSLIENGVFERIIVLSARCGPATVEKIISDGRVIARA